MLVNVFGTRLLLLVLIPHKLLLLKATERWNKNERKNVLLLGFFVVVVSLFVFVYTLRRHCIAQTEETLDLLWDGRWFEPG